MIEPLYGSKIPPLLRLTGEKVEAEVLKQLRMVSATSILTMFISGAILMVTVDLFAKSSQHDWQPISLGLLIGVTLLSVSLGLMAQRLRHRRKRTPRA